MLDGSDSAAAKPNPLMQRLLMADGYESPATDCWACGDPGEIRQRPGDLPAQLVAVLCSRCTEDPVPLSGFHASVLWLRYGFDYGQSIATSANSSPAPPTEFVRARNDILASHSSEEMTALIGKLTRETYLKTRALRRAHFPKKKINPNMLFLETVVNYWRTRRVDFRPPRPQLAAVVPRQR